jgi:hypothetical protein
MAVGSQRGGDVVEEVGTWLAGEFSGRLPAEVIDRVIRRTRQDVDGRIAPEELGEMRHRLGRARLYRILENGPESEIRIPHSR